LSWLKHDLCPQVRWHPRSQRHFAVLTSDNRFAVFDARQPAAAQQVFRLPLQQGTGGGRFGIGMLEDAGSGNLRCVDFAFGAGSAWDVLSVYLMTRCALHCVENVWVESAVQCCSQTW
jgi:hypothetical protein